jgi:hypothetical protein
MMKLFKKMFGKKNEVVDERNYGGCIPDKPDDRDLWFEPETGKVYQKHYVDDGFYDDKDDIKLMGDVNGK